MNFLANIQCSPSPAMYVGALTWNPPVPPPSTPPFFGDETRDFSSETTGPFAEE